MIAAFAAVTANGTENRVLANEGDDVIFTDVITQVGVTLINNVVLVCPSDAFYFVHYRLRQRTNQEGPPCTMALFVGQDVIEVSCFSTSRFEDRLWTVCFFAKIYVYHSMLLWRM